MAIRIYRRRSSSLDAAYLGYVAVGLMFLTGGYHLTGLRDLASDNSDEIALLVRAAWIVVAVDWFAVGVLMLAAILGVIPGYGLLVAGSIPLAAAVVLGFVVGPRFPGVWMLAIAGFCSWIAGIA